MNAFKLPASVAKRPYIISSRASLPIFVDDERWKSFAHNLADKKFVGKFNGYNVIVDEKDDIDILYTMGCFGKHFVSVNDSEKSKIFVQLRHSIEECNSTEDIRHGDESAVEMSAHFIEENNDNVKCINCTEEKYHAENRNTWKEKNKINSVPGELHLLLEEAFFLSFALNCINIYYKNQLLSLTEMWKLFQNKQSGFIDRYIGYHYFRAKGWVVNSGIKYGGDFLLYKEGPSFYHASFVVIINRIRNSNVIQNLSWKYLLSLYRSSETANKRVVICEISRPDDFKEDDISQLARCKVTEFILDRWVASENRIIS